MCHPDTAMYIIIKVTQISLCRDLDFVFSPDDTVGDLKKLIAAQTGTKWDRIVLKKW